MTESRTGGCQCGHVRYEISGPVHGLAVCHCRDCQRQSSSAFGMSLFVLPDDFHLTQGTLKTFEVTADSGRKKTCAFCPECGSRIYHRTRRGMSVKAGTLDDTSVLTPHGHYWTSRKQGWVTIPAGVPQFADDG